MRYLLFSFGNNGEGLVSFAVEKGSVFGLGWGLIVVSYKEMERKVDSASEREKSLPSSDHFRSSGAYVGLKKK